jgi:hypothetical protein
METSGEPCYNKTEVSIGSVSRTIQGGCAPLYPLQAAPLSLSLVLAIAKRVRDSGFQLSEMAIYFLVEVAAHPSLLQAALRPLSPVLAIEQL